MVVVLVVVVVLVAVVVVVLVAVVVVVLVAVHFNYQVVMKLIKNNECILLQHQLDQ